LAESSFEYGEATTPFGRGEEVVIFRVGTGTGEIVKLWAFDVPPPGAGLLTVMLAVPAVAMSLAEIDAVKLVAPLTVVVRSDPFHRTVEPETKLDPLTVRANSGLPATAESGLIPVIDGTGFWIVRVNSLVALATS
jgi:hypothetical protein